MHKDKIIHALSKCNFRLDCEKVRKGLGNTARDLANSLLQNIVDTYRKENEWYVL